MSVTEKIYRYVDFFTRGLIKCPIKIVGLSELPEVYKLMEEGKIFADTSWTTTNKHIHKYT